MTGKNIRKLVLAALLAALTAVATMIIRIPTPTQGYIHLGDGMVLICGILLGPGLGALAAGIGSMMADLIGGYMAWVPGTFAIKALTALLGGWLYHRMAGKGMNTITRVVLCGIPAEIIMVLGYFVYEVGMEVVMGSSMGAAAAAVVLGVPMNIVQGIAGIIVGAVLLPVLSHAKRGDGREDSRMIMDRKNGSVSWNRFFMRILICYRVILCGTAGWGHPAAALIVRYLP